jgi:2-polyprenyl-3-methyl-5-hydroxy-6-metoxy-1,4-benzoquinol methylase
MDYKIIKKCQICSNKNLKQILDLGNQPLCDDLKKKGVGKKYKTKIIFCDKCFTAFQKYNVDKKILFHKNYHYRARNTKDVVNGMKELANSALKKIHKSGRINVLDIGCNDGTLLDIFKKKGCKTYGIEPTNAFKDAIKKGHKIFNCFFNYKNAKKIKKQIKDIDIISFTNVFAHIDDLDELLKSLKIMLDKNTMVVIENHYLGEVIKKNQFDTFYHEHPRTYSLNSFLHIAERIKLRIEDVQFVKRYNGNIRVFLKNKNKKNNIKVKKFISNEKKLIKLVYKFQNKLDMWRVKKKIEVNSIVKKYGPISAKAYPGRAAILINLLGLNKDFISSVYEKKMSLKLGYLVPGTDIPIISDELLIRENNKKKIILNLAWHINKEIKSYLKKELNYRGKVIDILSKRDFEK